MKEERDFVLPHNAPETLLVHDICVNLIHALDEKQAEGMQWEVSVIQSDVVNAFVVPGGKIFVYTGLLEQVKTSGALAFILGHEISHAIARHGVEKIGILALGTVVTEAVGGFMGPYNQQYLQHLLFPLIQSFVVDRPYSRSLETEADALGLRLMARAAYDPREAVESWKRMQTAGGGKEMMELLSTHPSHASRIVALQKQMPEALRIQAQALKEKKEKGEAIPDSLKDITVSSSLVSRHQPRSILKARREQSAILASKASSLAVLGSQ